MRPSSVTLTNSVITRPAPWEAAASRSGPAVTTARLGMVSSPIRNGVNIGGGLRRTAPSGDPVAAAANQESTVRTRSGSRCVRLM